MNIIKTVFFLLAFLFLTALNVSASEILTNESVLKMVQAGLETEVIISKIKTSQNQFDTSVDEILRLKKEGVAGDIINAMMGVPENNNHNQQGDDYQKALSLLQEEKYDEAINILSLLSSKNSDVRYQFSRIEAMLEKSRIMKDAKDPNWGKLVKEAQSQIKSLYTSNSNNADYWLLYAKLLGLIGREQYIRDIKGAFEKAFYYKPGYPKGLLWQGDVYFMIAKSMTDDFSNSTRIIVAPNRKEEAGNMAKNAYKQAIDISNLSDEKKAEIYFNLGEIEIQIFRNMFTAINFWGQSIAAYPGGKWANLAQKRITEYTNKYK
jgi:hypothetical protein